MIRYIEITLQVITLFLQVQSLDRCLERNEWPDGVDWYNPITTTEIIQDDLDINYKITEIYAWFNNENIPIPPFGSYQILILNQI